jgi:flagellar motor switch/type III secretory pathway protein FliN
LTVAVVQLCDDFCREISPPHNSWNSHMKPIRSVIRRLSFRKVPSLKSIEENKDGGDEASECDDGDVFPRKDGPFSSLSPGPCNDMASHRNKLAHVFMQMAALTVERAERAENALLISKASLEAYEASLQILSADLAAVLVENETLKSRVAALVAERDPRAVLESVSAESAEGAEGAEGALRVKDKEVELGATGMELGAIGAMGQGRVTLLERCIELGCTVLWLCCTVLWVYSTYYAL